MKTKEEKLKILKEHFMNEQNEIDLSGIDFGDLNVNFSEIKANNISNKNQEADYIYNNYQKADYIENISQKAYNIYNISQEAYNIYNNYQVGWKSGMKVKCIRKNDTHSVGTVRTLDHKDGNGNWFYKEEDSYCILSRLKNYWEVIMKIEVGSKWKLKGGIVEVLENYNNDVVVISKNRGHRNCVFLDWFIRVAKPCVEFKRVTIERIEFFNAKENVWRQRNDKELELLRNYKRYREEVDTAEFEDDDSVYYINKKGDINILNYKFASLFGLVFSTRKHAQKFFELAQENDCL